MLRVYAHMVLSLKSKASLAGDAPLSRRFRGFIIRCKEENINAAQK